MLFGAVWRGMGCQLLDFWGLGCVWGKGRDGTEEKRFRNEYADQKKGGNEEDKGIRDVDLYEIMGTSAYVLP